MPRRLDAVEVASAASRRRQSAQGKTKVILPLFCMAFLSSNKAVRDALARGGREKRCLVVLVPEHLVPDARAQVYRYCLSLNFRQDYRIYDDIFALLHDDVRLDEGLRRTSAYSRSLATGHPPKKQIFVTSFNQFKKALTYDAICRKVYPNRDRVLVLVDEVDDFLDRCRRGVRFRRFRTSISRRWRRRDVTPPRRRRRGRERVYASRE